ncbi:hypothetical protein [Erythrobacter sp. HL-111]|uniref:hypothetical protein n=1 Tax=Erythrobacter sp. HL-111 TaxID=1798193 RepID=UPI0006DA4B2F|nr:hypothetical protein [Erythrobacter sp. HL-111]KPP92621.1 MAG: hypothetical protein HLUCCO15_07730 [Erythrobacteraceae bacterium HL-111]SDS94809.1 hypothetical protein SAMN04515621_2574 [Erythrobacter sp. HL-111]
MTPVLPDEPAARPVPARPALAWPAAALVGGAVPALAIVLFAQAPAALPLAFLAGPVIAVGLMGAGMIGAAADGRFGVGVLLALAAGAGLVLLAHLFGMAPLAHPLSAGIALAAASLSFAARGALFARSAAQRGWWIALFVIAGEVSIVLAAWAEPDALPDWLLALLPAQWASSAIQAAVTGGGARAAGAPLLALAGTAASTLLVARLWPRRWPYLVMFTAWLALSALVLHRPGPPLPQPRAEPAAAAASMTGAGAGPQNRIDASTP